MTGENLDKIASAVFRAKGSNQGQRNRIYSDTLSALGREDEKVTELRESMVSIERLLLFLLAEGRAADAPKPVREATKAALRDLQSLEEDAAFKAQKVQFLLDATLGLINLAQNDIIKLFSVLAVIFMPPTVIASIYGMNFKNMPELEWPWGYPLALVLMVCAAVLPYLFFRWKKWLEAFSRIGRSEERPSFHGLRGRREFSDDGTISGGAGYARRERFAGSVIRRIPPSRKASGRRRWGACRQRRAPWHRRMGAHQPR